jgi:CheY-like chemotaxis protein/HPt (histidine-containing phosphotransfer) domain-containing protein
MRGRIGVLSRVGSGSTFWFELHLGKCSGKTCVPLATLEGLRVLVIDDHETNRTILREMLQSWECRPETAGSAADALARLMAIPDADPFDLILLDLKLPGMDGEQTARVIRAIPRYAEVPLVLLTSLDTPAEPGENGRGLFVASITKPIKRSQLYNTLVRAVTAHESVHAPPVLGAKETVIASRPRILLAEDNNVNRRVAIGMAERLGCRVEAVCNGREAIEALDYHRHDMILMDVQMPEMDGFKATALIREREKTTGLHIPIIAMTAHAMQGDRERCLVAGMDGYVSKPLRAALLREAIDSFAGKDQDHADETLMRPSSGSRPCFIDSLREACGDDPLVISDVVNTLLEDVPERLERLEAAVAGKDGDRALREAHALKGGFLTVGAAALSSDCQELIRLVELADFSIMESICKDVRNEWTELKEQAVRYLETAPVGSFGDS